MEKKYREAGIGQVFMYENGGSERCRLLLADYAVCTFQCL
jgi:hypothetical protein